MTPWRVSSVRRLRAVADAVDADRLKRVGVVTYFGVYVAIAVGGWRALVGLRRVLPAAVRPSAVPAFGVVSGLPQSVAWALVSFTVALVAVGVAAARHVTRRPDDRPPSLLEHGRSGWLPRPSLRGVRRRLSTPFSNRFADEWDATAAAVELVDGSLRAPDDPLRLPRSGRTSPDRGFFVTEYADEGTDDSAAASDGASERWPDDWMAGDEL